MSYVKFEDVKKVYHMGEVSIEALRDATFEIEKGEICVITGASGAGKTTLLNILGGMDTLTEGRVFLDGREISALSERDLTSYRRYEMCIRDRDNVFDLLLDGILKARINQNYLVYLPSVIHIYDGF